MLGIRPWVGILLGLSLLVGIVLLSVWWRQRSYRWTVLLALCVLVAPALSWWSGAAFQVDAYRAGCDGLCPGHRGAPIAIFVDDATGYEFLPGGFLLNTLVYGLLLLAWIAIIRTMLFGGYTDRDDRNLRRGLVAVALAVTPFALAPLFLPPPQAVVRGDSQRIAINALREVYMYDQQATSPVLRVGLQDVRPRVDGSGMRVCLRTYTFFYLPTGYMFLDMTPEGVHSNRGGVLAPDGSCWE